MTLNKQKKIIQKKISHISLISQEENRSLYVLLKQNQFYEAIKVITHVDVSANCLLSIAVEKSADEVLLSYWLYDNKLNVHYIVSFVWEGVPIVSLHDFFKNARVLQKKSYEQHNIVFMDMWEHSVTRPQDKAPHEFERILWPLESSREPIVLRGEATHEKVKHAYIQKGYFHRGFERALLNRSYVQFPIYMSRYSPSLGMVYEYCYARHIEQRRKIPVDDYARHMRIALLESCRSRYHSVTIMQMLALIDEHRYSWLHNVTQAYDHMMSLVYGSFQGYVLCPGGMHHALSEDAVCAMRAYCEEVSKFYKKAAHLILGKERVKRCSKGLGTLGSQEILSLGGSGPILRASGAKIDVRLFSEDYQNVNFAPVVMQEGCAYARMQVFLGEIEASVKLTECALNLAEQKSADFARAWGAESPSLMQKGSVDMMKHCSFYLDGEMLEGTHVSCVEGVNGLVGLMLSSQGAALQSVNIVSSSLFQSVILEALSPNVDKKDLDLLIASLGVSMSESDG